MKIVEYDTKYDLLLGNVCPHCLKVNAETEGSSETLENNDVKFWCAYCGEVYLMTFLY